MDMPAFNIPDKIWRELYTRRSSYHWPDGRYAVVVFREVAIYYKDTVIALANIYPDGIVVQYCALVETGGRSYPTPLYRRPFQKMDTYSTIHFQFGDIRTSAPFGVAAIAHDVLYELGF